MGIMVMSKSVLGLRHLSVFVGTPTLIPKHN